MCSDVFISENNKQDMVNNCNLNGKENWRNLQDVCMNEETWIRIG